MYYPQPPPPPRKKSNAWAWIVGAVLVLCLIVAANLPKRERPAAGTSSTKPTAEKPQKSYEPVSATDLISAYDANEVAADQRWKGVDVEISGVVKEITKGPLGGPIVVLGNGNELETTDIHVHLKRKEANRAAQLSKGSTERFRGTVAGKVLVDVQIANAEVL